MRAIPIWFIGLNLELFLGTGVFDYLLCWVFYGVWLADPGHVTLTSQSSTVEKKHRSTIECNASSALAPKRSTTAERKKSIVNNPSDTEYLSTTICIKE